MGPRNVLTCAPFAFVFTFLACTSAFGQIARQHQQEFSVTDPKFSSVTLARIGPIDITAEEFLLNYYFGPAFPKRESNSKERYLQYMINEKLLALQGYAEGADRRSDVQNSLAEIEGDLATEEMYKQEVGRGVTVSAKELQDGIRKESIDLKVQWIYDPSETGIEKVHQALIRGSSFDSIFASQFPDSVVNADRSMDVTLFKLEIRNPVFARAIEHLPRGTPSIPIRGEDGWYIVKYSAEPNSMVITESQEMKMKEDVRRAIVKRKSDSLSDRFVQKIMTDQKPVIIRTSLNNIMLILARRILDSGTFRQWQLNTLAGNRGAGMDSISAERAGPRTLVQLRNGTLTVADFLLWYRLRETNLHVSLKGPQEFYATLEPLVWRMVRDKLLVRRAFAKGYQRRPIVTKQKRWWKDKLVYQAEKLRLAESVTINDSALMSYYENHRRDYRDSTGTVPEYKSVIDNVKKDYFSYEMMSKTVHELLRLKNKFPVTIRNEELAKLHVDTEEQPRAIDLYAVKPGGVFPRPAFPSIDYDWQLWN